VIESVGSGSDRLEIGTLMVTGCHGISLEEKSLMKKNINFNECTDLQFKATLYKVFNDI